MRSVPFRRLIPALVASAVVAVAALAGAGGARAGTSHEVDIVDFAFSPQTLVIQAGDTVTWTNLDVVEHTATGASFDSGLLAQGESYSLTFTTPGTYDYLCTPHPTMTGTIVVQAAPTAPSAGATAAPSTGGGLPDVAMAVPAPMDLRFPIGLGLVLVAIGLVVARRRSEA
jgi:plastocyanin